MDGLQQIPRFARGRRRSLGGLWAGDLTGGRPTAVRDGHRPARLSRTATPPYARAEGGCGANVGRENTARGRERSAVSAGVGQRRRFRVCAGVGGGPLTLPFRAVRRSGEGGSELLGVSRLAKCLRACAERARSAARSGATWGRLKPGKSRELRVAGLRVQLGARVLAEVAVGAGVGSVRRAACGGHQAPVWGPWKMRH